jgi:hypothetical protein
MNSASSAPKTSGARSAGKRGGATAARFIA